MDSTLINRRVRLLFIAVTSLVVLLAGCEKGDSGKEAPIILLADTTRFGCEDCTGAELMGSVTAVSADTSGTVYALTRNPPFVRLFRIADGESGAFGDRGQGPGELSRPFGIATLNNGPIAISDLSARRTRFFTASGAELEPPEEIPSALAISSTPSGNRILIVTTPALYYQPRVILVDRAIRVERVSLPAEVDSLVATEGNRIQFTLGFAASDHGTIAIGSGGEEYRIWLSDTAGNLLAAAERDIPRPPRSEEEIARLRGGIQLHPDTPDDIELPAISSEDPHFNMAGLRFDSSGRLWVRTFRDRNGTIWDIFDRELEYIGEVQVPEPIDFYHISGRRMVGETVTPGHWPELVSYVIQERE